MSARTGRPPSPISPTGVALSAWVDAETVEQVEQLAQDWEVSRADILRGALRFALSSDEFLSEGQS